MVGSVGMGAWSGRLVPIRARASQGKGQYEAYPKSRGVKRRPGERLSVPSEKANPKLKLKVWSRWRAAGGNRLDS